MNRKFLSSFKVHRVGVSLRSYARFPRTLSFALFGVIKFSLIWVFPRQLSTSFGDLLFAQYKSAVHFVKMRCFG